MARFTGKSVIVTGAGSGIGAATARRFAEEGAHVVLAGRRREKLEEVLHSLPGRHLVVQADISVEAEAAALIAAALQEFGHLDILVNNAGTAVVGNAAETKTAEWRRVMATNVDGVFFCTRAALPHIVETKGCIVNVSSVSGLGGDWGMSVYNASKGAISNFTRALALEYGSRGVRVNAVNPSFTHTEMTEGFGDDPAMKAKIAERIPLGRGADPSEIAAVIAFLASPDASFINGVNLPVDGGVSASNGQPNFGFG